MRILIILSLIVIQFNCIAQEHVLNKCYKGSLISLEKDQENITFTILKGPEIQISTLNIEGVETDRVSIALEEKGEPIKTIKGQKHFYLLINNEIEETSPKPDKNGAVLLKYDYTGNLLWKSEFGNGTTFVSDFIEVPDVGFLVVGTSSKETNLVDSLTSDQDVFLALIDFHGTVKESHFGGSKNDWGYHIKMDETGYYIGGDAESSDGDLQGEIAGLKTWLFKVDNDLNLIWSKSFPEYIRAMDIQISQGKVYSSLYHFDYKDLCIMDGRNGSIISRNSLDNNVTPRNIEITTDYIFVVGDGAKGNTVTKHNLSGEEVNRFDYTGKRTTGKKSVLIKNSLFISDRGNCDDETNGIRLDRVDYPEIVTNHVDYEVEKGLRLYPNPSSSFINVEGMPDGAKIEFFDFTGKLVMQSEQKSIDISELPKGMYIIRTNGRRSKFSKI